MRTLLFYVFLLAPCALAAQGIQFETGNWSSVLAKAQKEKKLIYVDVYTTWCGPCKMLEKNIFPQKEAGDKYNALFVNYRLDAEKGEGIAFAKKYEVSGYPTNLFIDPENEKVVYRIMGAPMEVSGFNANADVALAEQKDPMMLQRYEEEFAKGNRNPEFLEKYLEKTQRLDADNDVILDAYVATLDTKNLSDSDVYYLSDNVRTIYNSAVPLLYEYREVMARRYPDNDYGSFENRLERWLYPSVEKAAREKNEQKLRDLEAAIRRYKPEDANSSIFFYRKEYYDATGNAKKSQEVALEEVNYLAGLSLSDFKAQDEKELEKMRSIIRHQLSQMTLPEGANIDTIIEQNIAPNAIGLPSVRSANTLNDAAWKVYEDKKADKAQLEQAMQWAQKAMEFSKLYPHFWPSYADTYAALLYRSGQKEAAIKIEEQAWQTAKSVKSDDAEAYQKTLKKMKEGKF